jgi:TolA-binding protein
LVKAAPVGPNYLCSQVLAWTRAHPDDPRVPEALHLAVKSTRFGLTDDKTSDFSRRAFRLLHSRYPKSEWAAKTKYWF